MSSMSQSDDPTTEAMKWCSRIESGWPPLMFAFLRVSRGGSSSKTVSPVTAIIIILISSSQSSRRGGGRCRRFKKEHRAMIVDGDGLMNDGCMEHVRDTFCRHPHTHSILGTIIIIIDWYLRHEKSFNVLWTGFSGYSQPLETTPNKLGLEGELANTHYWRVSHSVC